ncbi:immune inhibitor A domain-containing protein [Actinoplanes sp. NBRC 103695]|uniref:immune inhibitor A domain-containing protein n=1 Tax=Actinoplanes sp. NBRC 103695 TaxID=3032202 RepID=UPI0025561833|nr:immune inhibitor A domain-containing protein [Actinoplanes sp. NBRC 103695]
MRRVVAGLLGAAMVTSVGVSLPSVALAAPPETPAAAGKRTGSDELPNPAEEKRRESRQDAVNGILKGKIKAEKRGASRVAKLADGEYVELAREKTDKIFVILAEFGNERHPDFPDVDSDPATIGPATFDGPLHNAIPAPNRAVDNRTVWQADYNRDHFQQMYFGTGANVESLKTYYEAQSSGRYSVDGEVSDWVKVRYNEARYGRDCDINGLCTDEFMWQLVKDAANQWIADQRAAGRTDAQIKTDLASYDQWDRYDYDHDGNFNEPDGYLDHFQIVHAGGDQADGDRQQGEDAIWSHRWFAFQNDRGSVGPAGNPYGGTQVGDTGFWIGDYTVQPENGGLSVFAHEYGHDLGLPDDYDTSGGLNNNSEFWTLMAQSRLSDTGEALGTRPGDLGAWNKLQLGWLDYELVVAGQKKTLTLGPQEYNTDQAQAAVVVLPDIQKTTQVGAPFAGARQWFSGNDDNLNTTLSKSVDLTGATSASFDLKGRFAIERCCDFLYAEASTDNRTWTALDGTVNGQPFPRTTAGKPVLTGTQAAWADISVPLTAYAGQRVQLRLRYSSDQGGNPGGFFGDDLTIKVNGTVQSTDGAEGTATWAATGFSTIGSSVTKAYDNFYIAGNRTYTSYDKYLKTGPYNFGWAADRPLFTEHFAYQQGLLISYANSFWRDNQVNVHPGEGRNLIIDSHPQAIYNIDGLPWRSRVMLYDAPFGLTKADSMTLHVNGKASLIRGKAGVPLFDDTRSYFDPAIPYAGVKLPATGVKIRVVEQTGTSVKIRVS